MMTNQPPTEKWMPLQCIAGECSLSRMEYDATNLLVELDSFLEKRVIKVVFSDVFSYRVTLEHFRWADFVDTPKTKSTLVRVVNSNFVKWLEAAGEKQLYGNNCKLKQEGLCHYDTASSIFKPPENPMCLKRLIFGEFSKIFDFQCACMKRGRIRVLIHPPCLAIMIKHNR